MTALERRILDALAASGGGLCAVELRRQVQIRGSMSHLHRAVRRLAESGLVAVTERDGTWSSGALIALTPAPDATLAGNDAARAGQTRPEAP